jgi:hypothetical protein
LTMSRVLLCRLLIWMAQHDVENDARVRRTGQDVALRDDENIGQAIRKAF